MTYDAVMDKLSDIFRSQFNDAGLVLTPTTVAQDVPGWNSLGHIRLILNVERTFGIKFKTSEVAGFNNLGELATMVQHKLGA